MPASPERRQIMLRLDQDVVEKLDRLCATYSAKHRRVLHRSSLVTRLVEEGISRTEGSKLPPLRANGSLARKRPR